MLDNELSKKIFHYTSRLTEWFPRGGAWFFDHTLVPLLGHSLLVKEVFRRNLRTVKDAKNFKRILVISDIHIGDAILAYGAVVAFRDFFPEARIDYVIKREVACFFEGNPDITNLYPVFTGGQYPNENDLVSVQKLVAENQYDLCLNCCPFFEDGRLFPKGQKVLNMMTAAAQILRNLMDKTGTCHFMYQSYGLPAGVLSKVMEQKRPGPFKGVAITLSDKAISEADSFIQGTKVPQDKPLVFLNPDTASVYNRIPFEKQLELLRSLLAMPIHLLLGSGFTAKDIEKKLLEKLTDAEKAKITVVPTSVSLDGYAALIDHADVFISGDTGPLHMAAARKVSKSGKHPFSNKTFVVSIFGATNSRMSGYDSTDPLYPAANQDVPSRCYVSESPCRNITCMNKMAKTCKDIRCYEVLNVEVIASDIRKHLKL